MRTLTSVVDAIFGPHKRAKRVESFHPRHTLSEWWCILWHRIGVRCVAHALGLEAYGRVFNAKKVDSWVPDLKARIEP